MIPPNRTHNSVILVAVKIFRGKSGGGGRRERVGLVQINFFCLRIIQVLIINKTTIINVTKTKIILMK